MSGTIFSTGTNHGQPLGYFSGVVAYHDALLDAFCGCESCVVQSDELRSLYDEAELIRLKSRRGHAALASWSRPLPTARKADCCNGLLLGVDPLDCSSDESDGYYGDDVGNYYDDQGDDY